MKSALLLLLFALPSDALRVQGNNAFGAARYEEAVGLYTDALGHTPRSAVLYANRALALLKLAANVEAEEDCDAALLIDPGFVKAMLRRAQARHASEKYEGALEDLEAALATLDTDNDGEITAPEWEDAIETALANKLADRAAKRELQAKAAAKEIEEFTANFLNAAREAFALIDKDDSGSLSKTEIVRAVREDRPVIDFLRNCGEENLQFLLQPARLEKALDQLDTDNSGEVDVDECTGAASCFYV